MGVHTDDPGSERVPGSHFKHEDKEFPPANSLFVLLGQAAHVDDDTAPVIVLKRPETQSSQLSSLGAATALLYRPETHAVHADAFLAPSAMPNRPAGQARHPSANDAALAIAPK